MSSDSAKHYSPVYILILVSALFLSACTGRAGSTISPEKMAEVLFDIHTAEVLASIKDTNDRIILIPEKDSARLIDLYQSILQHHNISFREFTSNYKYYIEKKPTQLDTIYRNIQEKIIDLQSIKVQSAEGSDDIPAGAEDTAEAVNESTLINRLRPEKLKPRQLEVQDEE